MAPVTIGFGTVLVILGVVGYFATGSTSPTALIPAAFGVVFWLLGGLAFKNGMRKHAMHLAAVLGLIGCVVPAVRGFPGLVCYLIGDTVEHLGAAIANSIMAVICGVFLALCIRSFVAARRARVTKGLG